MHLQSLSSDRSSSDANRLADAVWLSQELEVEIVLWRYSYQSAGLIFDWLPPPLTALTAIPPKKQNTQNRSSRTRSRKGRAKVINVYRLAFDTRSSSSFFLMA